MKQQRKSKAKKFDKGKRRWMLLDWCALEEVVDVLELGAAKYGSYNWKTGISVNRYLNALFRHLTAYASGEQTDAESGKSHMAHIICNAMFILYAEAKDEKEE